MPPADDAFTILVCECGKRLKAPGAVPGRVGRCPACGGTLRAPGRPEAAPESAPVREIRSSRPRPVEARPSAETSEPAETLHPARVGTEIKRPTGKGGAIGREGLVTAPARSEPGLRANLLYPLWDGNGVAMLIFLPPILWLTSILSLGLIPSYVIGADLVTKMGAMTMIFPMTILLAFSLGFVGLFLGGVIAAGAEGDPIHPRVPPWQLGPVLTSLFRWLWAAASGMLVAAPLLLGYRAVREAIGPKDWAVAAVLAAPGLLYAGMAAVAIFLHESLLASNPWTVGRALRKGGADSARLALILTAFAAAVAGAAVFLFVGLPGYGILAVIVGVWAFWFATLYGATVLARVLGLFYHRHARVIGWFSERRARGS